MRQNSKPAMLSLALIVILSTWSAAVGSNARASRVLGETGPAGQAETVGDPDLEPGFPVQTLHRAGTYGSGQIIHTLVGNIDDEPTAEILVTGLARGPLYAWNSDGTLQSGWPVGGGEWEVATIQHWETWQTSRPHWKS